MLFKANISLDRWYDCSWCDSSPTEGNNRCYFWLVVMMSRRTDGRRFIRFIHNIKVRLCVNVARDFNQRLNALPISLRTGLQTDRASWCWLVVILINRLINPFWCWQSSSERCSHLVFRRCEKLTILDRWTSLSD